ncbi:MAG: hypothetical protein DCF15_17385 [Phormidesmis priestleyi]|uniref:EamA family transporter n=1 Tax=Phormidesmis priestleyi TaxID=268141 RepID=A0A2W4YPR0_9CYAN|nr:MAG: hypothetical protein DCF15_17385 [Phormidesmis priestleyi]
MTSVNPASEDSEDIDKIPAEPQTPQTPQERYAEQLYQDIERLEAIKASLQANIATLQSDYKRLKSAVQAAESAVQAETQAGALATLSASNLGPRLPGEPALSGMLGQPTEAASIYAQPIHLPITTAALGSEREQSLNGFYTQGLSPQAKADLRKGLGLSAIATGLVAWHFGVVSALGQGGSWLGVNIGQLGTGFVPAVALLWLRMLVTVPILIALATQLYQDTWEDIQDWVYSRDQLLILLISSGVALFFSQVLLYQCLSNIGPGLGAVLLFLYPLTAVPLGKLMRQERDLSGLGLLGLVAIAMGGLLAIRPILSSNVAQATAQSTVQSTGAVPNAIWLGLLASLAFSLYIGLTQISYRQQCHPIPVSIAQLSTVAVLSSIVLLVKPLKLVDISWLSLTFWGLLLGLTMTLVYLLQYVLQSGNLRIVGVYTAMVAAATPLAAVMIGWSFDPTTTFEIIQWTGTLLVSVGGIALAQDKLKQSQ